MQPEFILGIVSFFASLLTFFSGFGLGTLLLPVFAMFYDLNSAVLLTACVHLLNNLFKFVLVYRHIAWRKALSFCLFALPASVFGAWLLGILNNIEFSTTVHTIATLELRLSALKISLGFLMLLFGIWEFLNSVQKFDLSDKWFGFFAFLSGLLGGFSGHQGALRTIVLSKAKLEKQTFVATGICIACFVDLARIPIYISEDSLHNITLQAILPAILPAFAGAWLGNRFLRKMEVRLLKWIIGTYLILMGIFIGLGII